MNQKSPSNKKKGRSKKAHVLSAAVQKATENFIARGEEIANENPDIRVDMMAAVDEVRKTGQLWVNRIADHFWNKLSCSVTRWTSCLHNDVYLLVYFEKFENTSVFKSNLSHTYFVCAVGHTQSCFILMIEAITLYNKRDTLYYCRWGDAGLLHRIRCWPLLPVQERSHGPGCQGSPVSCHSTTDSSRYGWCPSITKIPQNGLFWYKNF